MARKLLKEQKESLFEEKLVPAKPGSDKLFDVSYGAEESKPVRCLGLDFANEEARRAYFLEKLRAKLKDPEFRKIEGFPIGEDDDILTMSDPPYYTACPNPFFADLLSCYGRPYDPKNDTYHREPFSSDVTEGKTDIIYTAHTYHTKVPPKAIAKYIEHYTDPGDTVLDFFAGSGMTSVACRLCADHSEGSGHMNRIRPELARIGISIDLAPAATFIAKNYLWPLDSFTFVQHAKGLIESVSEARMPSYQENLASTDEVEYVLWIEVFECPVCQEPIISRLASRATEDIGTAFEFPCEACGAMVSKAPPPGSQAHRFERRLRTVFDQGLGNARKTVWRTPISAQVSTAQHGRHTVPFGKHPELLEKQSKWEMNEWFPTNTLIHGERYLTKDCCASYGVTHIHHFYLPRQLATYALLWRKATEASTPHLRHGMQFFLQSNSLSFTILNRYQPTQYGKETGGSQVNRSFSGTLYIPSAVAEVAPRYAYKNKLNRLVKAFGTLYPLSTIPAAVSTQSATDLRNIPDNSIDYIFVDPPFGRNLQYSELNQVWEAWHRVMTNRGPEAIMDSSRKRDVLEYTNLMRSAFQAAARVLKPGRWMTVEFHNSSNAVWHAIQESLLSAGFMVSDVRTLNKVQETYKQSKQGLVKQDLVISAYKPPFALEERFRITAGSEEGAWVFVRQHLSQLPVVVTARETREVISERQNYLLFDRMVAFHVQRNVSVPLSASEFYAGLRQRFPERDGMYFLPEQVGEYEEATLDAKKVEQYEFFVSDERSAIQWIRAQLSKTAMTYQVLQPLFMREAQRIWEKHEQPVELQVLLEQNFVVDADDSWRLPDSKREGDLEQLRHHVLVKEFQHYLDSKSKLKVVRTEALRAGFKDCWQKKDYSTIIQMAKRIPEAVIQEDSALLMYFDNASLLVGDLDKGLEYG
jgi:16S rRNA G966 N2-methylase RsmD